jgi:hypothetical protein
MGDVLGEIPEEELEELPGCPNRALGVQVIKEANPHSYAIMPKLQLAIASLKWHYGVNRVVQEFRRNPDLRALATDPATGEVHEKSPEWRADSVHMNGQGNSMVSRPSRRQMCDGEPGSDRGVGGLFGRTQINAHGGSGSVVADAEARAFH